MKRLLIFILMLGAVQMQADAQLLKKLGKAIDKGLEKLDKAADALEKVAGGVPQQTQNTSTNKNRQTADAGKVIGQPVKIGQSTLTKLGDNPGVDINWQGLYRIYGNTVVTAYFQLVNKGELKAGISFDGSTKNYALDNQGRQYWDEAAMAGNRRIGANSIEPGTKSLYTFNYVDVPASVKEMQMVLFGLMSYIGNQGQWHEYGFRINDAPIRVLPAVTAKGIVGEEQVLVGQSIAQLPKSFPMLYDRYTVSTEDDEGDVITIVTFTLEGQEVMSAVSYDRKTIDNISLTTAKVYFRVGQSYYTCGTPMNKIKYTSGVQTDETDYGTIVSYQNMTFDEDTDGNICTVHIHKTN